MTANLPVALTQWFVSLLWFQ